MSLLFQNAGHECAVKAMTEKENHSSAFWGGLVDGELEDVRSAPLFLSS